MDDDESSVSLRCSTTGPPPLPLLLFEVLRLLMLLMGCRNGVEVKKGLRFSALLGLENDKRVSNTFAFGITMDGKP